MWTEAVKAPPHCTLPLPRGRWRIGTLLQHRPWLCCSSMGPWHTAGGQAACILKTTMVTVVYHDCLHLFATTASTQPAGPCSCLSSTQWVHLIRCPSGPVTGERAYRAECRLSCTHVACGCSLTCASHVFSFADSKASLRHPIGAALVQPLQGAPCSEHAASCSGQCTDPAAWSGNVSKLQPTACCAAGMTLCALPCTGQLPMAWLTLLSSCSATQRPR